LDRWFGIERIIRAGRRKCPDGLRHVFGKRLAPPPVLQLCMMKSEGALGGLREPPG
jgi:hypothetical protein